MARLTAALADRYTIDRELGQGGMAMVYLAEDLKHGRKVAIKVLREELSAAIGADRFVREIKVVAKLQHPHVLPLLDSCLDGSCLYYVTPYVRGETLRELLVREGRLSVDQAVILAREIADALAYSHREGVVHRDIKPENILLQEGHAVVADFGIARALAVAGGDSLTQAGFAVGTPTYMSPEQATGASEVDGRSDVYAVGCLLFEMLTGTPPFTGDTLQQVAAAHVTTPAPPIAATRSDTPRWLAQLVGDCLAKNPDDRPDAGTLASRLKAAVSTAHRSAFTPRTIAMAGAGIALFAAAAWWGTSRSAEPTLAVTDGAELIAVMPLSAISDTSLSRLGQDLVVTLSTTLDGVGELQTVDAATLLLSTRSAPNPLPLSEAQRIGAELGASRVVTGTLIGEGSQVRAAVSLFSVDADTVISRATALAPADEIGALTDSLTWQLLRQIWRSADAPSPVLSGLTTESFEALRLFLDGELAFRRVDADAAIELYRRAFEIDSNFVQAYLRYDFTRSWNLMARDQVAHERLLRLADKLPERERLWLETRELRTPLPERVAAWRALMARYPDYPPILMSGVDLIIHSGPVYGISLNEAVPILDRLARLSPDHADTKLHLAMVATELGSPAEAAETQRLAADASEGVNGVWSRLSSWVAERGELGESQFPREEMIEYVNALGDLPATGTFFAIGSTMGWGHGKVIERLDLLDSMRVSGAWSIDQVRATSFGEGILRLSRGDWQGGLDALEQYQSARVGPVQGLLARARAAVLGAWLGNVDPQVAGEAVASAWMIEGVDANSRDRVELLWLDGLAAILRNDESRVDQVRNDLAGESNPRARHATESLRALDLHRRGDPTAPQTIQALSDAAMTDGDFVYSAEAVHRFVIARTLRNVGRPEEAERYLRWVDASLNNQRTFSLRAMIDPLVRYERGMALEEAGLHDDAVHQLSRFLASHESPLPDYRDMVAAAQRVVFGEVSRDTEQQPTLPTSESDS